MSTFKWSRRAAITAALGAISPPLAGLRQWCRGRPGRSVGLVFAALLLASAIANVRDRRVDDR
jgi:hypothetical protein